MNVYHSPFVNQITMVNNNDLREMLFIGSGLPYGGLFGFYNSLTCHTICVDHTDDIVRNSLSSEVGIE